MMMFWIKTSVDCVKNRVRIFVWLPSIVSRVLHVEVYLSVGWLSQLSLSVVVLLQVLPWREVFSHETLLVLFSFSFNKRHTFNASMRLRRHIDMEEVVSHVLREPLVLAMAERGLEGLSALNLKDALIVSHL